MNDVEVRKLAVELAIKWEPRPANMIDAAREIYAFLSGGAEVQGKYSEEDLQKAFTILEATNGPETGQLFLLSNSISSLVDERIRQINDLKEKGHPHKEAHTLQTSSQDPDTPHRAAPEG